MPESVIQLVPADAPRYARIRQRMLAGAPWAFGSSPEDDPSLDPQHLVRTMRDEHVAVFAVREQGDSDELIAVCGIRRLRRVKTAHRASLWGVWVDPAHRRRGLARQVIESAIARARQWDGVDYIDLAVTERATEAQRLYETLGFQAWGREPETIAYDGHRYDEIYMSLRLR